MFCSKCGARLEDDAAFCTECGARVMRDPATTQPLMPDQAPSPMPGQAQPVSPAAQPTTRMPAVIPPAPIDPASRRRDPRPTRYDARESKERLVVAAGLVGVLIVGVVAGYFFGVHLPAQKAPATQATQAESDAAATTSSPDRSDHAVKISVKAEGWDTDAGASKLPVHIEGTDVDGNAVSTTAYVDSYGVGILLKQGKYELSVSASPLGAKGELWSPQSSKATITLGGSLREGEGVDVGETVVINLGSPLSAADVTDDAVERAARYAQDGGCSSAAAAQALVRAATDSRDDANRQKRDSELACGTYTADNAYSCDDFSFSVPDEWGTDWSVVYDLPEDKGHPGEHFRRYRIYRSGQSMFSILCDAIDYGGYSKAIKQDTLSNGDTFCLLSAGEKDDDTSVDGCATILSTLVLR